MITFDSTQIHLIQTSFDVFYRNKSWVNKYLTRTVQSGTFLLLHWLNCRAKIPSKRITTEDVELDLKQLLDRLKVNPSLDSKDVFHLALLKYLLDISMTAESILIKLKNIPDVVNQFEVLQKEIGSCLERRIGELVQDPEKAENIVSILNLPFVYALVEEEGDDQTLDSK